MARGRRGGGGGSSAARLPSPANPAGGWEGGSNIDILTYNLSNSHDLIQHLTTRTHTYSQYHTIAIRHSYIYTQQSTNTHTNIRTRTLAHDHARTHTRNTHVYLLQYTHPTLPCNHVNAMFTNSYSNSSKVLNWLFPQPGPGGSGVVGRRCTSHGARGWDLWGELLNTENTYLTFLTET